MIVLYIVIGLMMLLLFVAAMAPKQYNIEKTIIIGCPPADVIQRVADLNYYKQWNPWQQTEPAAKAMITGEPKTQGHKYSWQGKKIGAGNLTIRDIDTRHIHFDLEFIRPWRSKARDNWLFEEWGNAETKVTWQNAGNLPFPVARLMWPMMSKSLHQQFVNGLINLKNLCESGHAL